jgi:pseudouridine synthase
MRLNKFLSQCGVASRRNADELIARGRIYVNGAPETRMGVRIDPDNDTVAYKGKSLQPVRCWEYLKLYKPPGIIVSRGDPQGRRTIYDFLASRGRDAGHLKYVGRLDLTSEGLLILTNDGDMIHAVTHPRFHIKKVYRVRLDKKVTPEHLDRMRTEGVVSEGDTLRVSEITPCATPAGRREHWYTVVLHEGKNRQIRRICEGLGYRVIRLIRTRFGSVRLHELGCGEAAPLDDKEIRGLKAARYPVR